MAIIKLQSSDGDVFAVDVEVAKKSCTIRNMLNDLGIEDPAEIDVVPIPNVRSEILRKVLEWSTYHKDEPDPNEMADDYWEKMKTEIHGWDVEFFQMEHSALLELVMAANYLDVRGLLDTACKAVANLMNGKTPEEIRRTFNVRNDFTPQEEARIRQESEWHQ
jgi:S-phase kinase-associated protein 1